MPACFRAAGWSANRSAMARRGAGTGVPLNVKIFSICFRLVTGMMPATTGTWMPLASSRYMKL